MAQHEISENSLNRPIIDKTSYIKKYKIKILFTVLNLMASHEISENSLNRPIIVIYIFCCN